MGRETSRKHTVKTLKVPTSAAVLEAAIEDKFSELEERMKNYCNTEEFTDWSDCIDLLPQIADLVQCLKIEALQAEGQFPIN